MKTKTYPKYRSEDVGFEGELPAHWTAKRLKFVGALRMSNVDKKSVDGQKDVDLCNYVDVYKNERITSGMEFMPATATKQQIERFGLRRGDVLLTKDSETPDDIAVPAVVDEDLGGVLCGYHLAMVRPKKHHDGRYLARAISARGLREQFYIEALGVTRFGLGYNAIGCARLPAPPPDEQRRIADFLDRETERLDGLIAEKEKLIGLLEEKRKAAISEAVTKGLNPNAKMRNAGVPWLEEIPAHWKLTRLKFLSHIRYGLGQPPPLREDGLPFVRATNVFRGRIAEDGMIRIDPDMLPLARDPLLKTNDIIVVRSGAYTGDSAIIPPEYNGAASGYDMVVRANHRANPHFLAWSLLSVSVLTHQIDLCRIRAAQPHLNAEELGDCLLTEPPLAEQEQISIEIGARFSAIDKAQESMRTAAALLLERRAALVAAAVTGQIDVREEML